MKVLISGLTAAGKTTHSKLLAGALSTPWFGATEILMQLAGMGSPSEGFFMTSAASELEAVREGDQLDRRLDSLVLERLSDEHAVVVDAWATPWLATDPEAVRVWLASDSQSRSRKCVVSHMPRTLMTIDEARRHIDEKDNSTRSRFSRMYDFDLFSDHDKFDVVVCNTDLIPEPTRLAADAGIAEFAPILLAAVRVASGSRAASDLDALTSARRGTVKFIRGWSDE